jgi:inosine-uridine nucleoside N-ribohydrolase
VIPSDQKWWVDTDNALGSGSGDVDDAFAVAHLMAQIDPQHALFTPTFGNTTLQNSLINTIRLNDQMFASKHRVTDDLAILTDFARLKISNGQRLSVLALGPLTNITSAWDRNVLAESDIEEISIVALNSKTLGRWPPYFPMEFNVTQDLPAFRRVWSSSVPLRIFSLNALKKLRFHPNNLRRMSPNMNALFGSEVRRWIRRCTFLKARRWFPVWDLCAAVYATHPQFFHFEKTQGQLSRNGFVKFGRGERPVTLLQEFDEQAVWRVFWEKFST